MNTRKIAIVLAIAWLCLAIPQPAAAAPTPDAPKPKPKPKQGWWIDGDARVQGEAWDYFNPGGGFQNSYDFAGIRLRPRLHYDSPRFSGQAEVQDVLMLGVPRHAVAPGAGSLLGVGASYYVHSLRPSINTLGLRQAWIRIGDPKAVGLQVGRMEYASAMESNSGDATLEWVKRVRLKDRLIGTFDYSNFSRTFDGGRLDVDSPFSRVTAFAAHPTQGGFEPHFATEINRVFVSNLAWTIKRSSSLPNSEGQMFWTHYGDTRDVPFVDNRAVARRGRVGTQGGVRMDTYGFHFVTRLGKQGDGMVWYAHQTGKWGTLTHAADAYAIELGYRLADVPWKPWIRAGYNVFSGDGNGTDRQHGTFIPPLPTPRPYARFPWYTMANLRDAFAQVIVAPGPSTNARLDLHFLSLDKANDLWYAGAGATQQRGSINGYAGRVSGGATSLGTQLDVSVEHKFNDNHAVTLYLGHVFGGQVQKIDFPAGRDANFIMLDYDLKLP